jgi:hypothetical protein
MKQNKGNFFALLLQYVNLLSTSNIHPILKVCIPPWKTILDHISVVGFLPCYMVPNLFVFKGILQKIVLICLYITICSLHTKKKKIKCKTLQKNPRESGWIIRKNNTLLDLTNLKMKHEPFAKIINCIVLSFALVYLALVETIEIVAVKTKSVSHCGLAIYI